MNCFSVDVEGFVESNVQSINISEDYISSSRENYEIEKNLNVTLSLLDELNIKGTFFFLGRIGSEIPQIVKRTADQGHEIACHSNEHIRIYDQSRESFRDGLIYAKKTLEDCVGNKVYGFRAPDFSITKSSLWALDILKEAGFTYDSSICPTGVHDVYGIDDANPYIHKRPNGLAEFPVSTINISGKRIPFGGGGYFRLYPLFLTKYFALKVNRKAHPCMFYMHPYEIGPVIPEIAGISCYRKFRHYYNCSNGINRLQNFLKDFKFDTAIGILRDMGLQKDDKKI
jgi:polysaccharide deacetylase family protein (PEP-CTERM system associated)